MTALIGHRLVEVILGDQVHECVDGDRAERGNGRGSRIARRAAPSKLVLRIFPPGAIPQCSVSKSPSAWN